MIGDLLNIVVLNLSHRSSLRALEITDYDLLARLISLTVYVVVSVSPSHEPDTIKKTLAPLLINALNVLNDRLKESLSHYLFPNSEFNKYPLRLLIKLSNMKFPLCSKEFLFYHFKRMIGEAINLAVDVCFVDSL